MEKGRTSDVVLSHLLIYRSALRVSDDFHYVREAKKLRLFSEHPFIDNIKDLIETYKFLVNMS